MPFRSHLAVAAATVLATIAVGIPVASLAQSGPVAAVDAVATAAPVASSLAAPLAKGDAKAKLTIISLDDATTITAQYNPKEVHVTKTVPWTKAPTSTADQPELTFTSAEGRRMSFELSFDGFETKTNVHAQYVAKLFELSEVMAPNGPEDKKRPPRVKVQWGTAPTFEGVIESVDVKYTTVGSDGTPLRATAVVNLREASRASFRRK